MPPTDRAINVQFIKARDKHLVHKSLSILIYLQ